MTVRRVTVAERRARLGLRHCLAASAKADGAEAVAEAVVALHATDPATVYLSVHARLSPRAAPGAVGAVQQALYDDRRLVRMLGMRRTMFVVPVDLAAVVHASSTLAVATRERRRIEQAVGAAAVTTDPAAWLAAVEEATVLALAERGEALGAELSAAVPGLRTRILVSEGKSYEAFTNITTWVLNLLSAEGRIVRGRPRGSWVSSQYRWAPMAAWLPAGLADVPVEEAEAELVRRWLAAFGPAPVSDIKWWTGWTVAAVKRALGRLEVAEVDLDGAPGVLLTADLDRRPPRGPKPWVALLPALDPTPMGWQQRDWFLGDHAKALFDRSGNIGPTVWSDGRIVGGWAQRRDGEIAYRLLEDAGTEAAAAVERVAAELTTHLGDSRFTPRFRTPLERELTA